VANQGSIVESYCYCHNTNEVCAEKHVYIVCFECGHIWTKRTLLKAYHRQSKLSDTVIDPTGLFGPVSRWSQVRYWFHRWTMRPSRIYFCQECIHDF
jgi:hypothetical protein